MAGGVTANTARHETVSISTPPMRGPTTPPRAKLAVQIPSATDRCAGSWNIDRISEIVEGPSIAAPIPISPRQTISTPGPVDSPAATEARPNTPAPTSSNRRRPNRSASRPIGSSRPATRKT
jgi:hypothetical protein